MALALAHSSVSYRDPGDEVVIVRFKPTDPLTMTEVELDGPYSQDRALALIEETAARLTVYVEGCRDATAHNGDPITDDAGDHTPDDVPDAAFRPAPLSLVRCLDDLGRD